MISRIGDYSSTIIFLVSAANLKIAQFRDDKYGEAAEQTSLFFDFDSFSKIASGKKWRLVVFSCN